MQQKHQHRDPYPRFFLMLATSFVIMYGVMFLNVWEFDHVRLNVNRAYMAVLMVAPMAVVMLLYMRHMYTNKGRNIIILSSAVVVFVLALWALRSQAGIADEQYMKAMIPHHSSAILTSERAAISDPEVRKLADEIIESQKEEIAQMKRIIERMEDR